MKIFKTAILLFKGSRCASYRYFFNFCDKITFLVIKELIVKRFRWKKLSMHSRVVLSVSAVLLLLGTLLIKLTEGGNISWLGVFFTSVSARTAGFLICCMEPNIPLRDVLFEMVSAFGTVGLSTGITPSLSTGSKLVSIAAMYYLSGNKDGFRKLSKSIKE